MDEHEKATYQVIDEFFKAIPELSPIRDHEDVKTGIKISYMLFFGDVVLLCKAASKLMQHKDKNLRMPAEAILRKILSFLDDCLKSNDSSEQEDSDSRSYLESARAQAAYFFTEGLYNASTEYQNIVNLAPARLKTDIERVEKYYGIPQPSKYGMYGVMFKELKAILIKQIKDQQT